MCIFLHVCIFLSVLLAIFVSICSFHSPSPHPLGHIYFSFFFSFSFLSVFFLSICLFNLSIHPAFLVSVFSLYVLFSFCPAIHLSFFCLFFCKSVSISLYLSVHSSFSPSLFLLLSIYPSNLSCLSVFICLSILSFSLSYSPSEHTLLCLPTFKPTLHSFGLVTDATPHVAVRTLAVEMPVLSGPTHPRGLWDAKCFPSAGGNEECLNKASLNES